MTRPTPLQQQSVRTFNAHERLQQLAGGLFLPNTAGFADQGQPIRMIYGEEKIASANIAFSVAVPEKVTNPHPAVIAHGYCTPYAAYEGLQQAMAANGQVTGLYYSPRNQKGLAGLHTKHLGHPERLLSQAVWGVMRGMLARRREIDLESDKFQLTGHSMGGYSVVNAALNHPKFVDSLLLNQPVGIGNNSTLKLVKRLPTFMSKELVPAILHEEEQISEPLKILLHSLKYILSNPTRAAAEGINASSCNSRQKIAQLREQDIKTAVVVGLADTLISATDAAIHSGREVDVFAAYANPNANHLHPITRPLETAHTLHQIAQEMKNPSTPPQSLAMAA